jgi:Rieske 2Fe-2S family protein
LLVDHESVVPESGDYVVRNCAGESIILVRDREGQIRAFFNVCRHRGSIICREESGHGRTFVCPYHAWTYDLDGSLRAARSMPEDFQREQYGLRECNVGVTHGLVFVNMGREEPPSFAAFSGRFDPYLEQYGIADAKVAHREVFETTANWKCASENLGECYHCAPVHPTYARAQVVDLVPLNDEARERQCELDTEHRARLPLVSDTPDSPYLQAAGQHEIGRGRRTVSVGGHPVAPLMGHIEEYDGMTAGMMFNPLAFLVSYADYTFFSTFVPRAVDRTDLEVVWLVAKSAMEGVDFHPAILSHLWTLTTEEDRIILNENHQGISSSAYRPGPYSRDEVQVVEFLTWYMKHFVDAAE